MKKVVLTTVAAAMIGIILVGCGESESDKKHKENVAFLADQKRKEVNKEERYDLFIKCMREAHRTANENAHISRKFAMEDRALVDSGKMTEAEYDKRDAERDKKYPLIEDEIAKGLLAKTGLTKEEIEEFKNK